jgi:hypothetical protein
MRKNQVIALQVLLSLPSLVLISPTSFSQTFDCNEIKQVIGESEDQFSSLVGEKVGSESLADLASKYGVPDAEMEENEYLSERFSSKSVLTGATSCEITRIRSADDSYALNSSGLSCKYPEFTAIEAGLIQQISSCVGGEIDADGESAEMVIDSAVSGEGYNTLSISLSANKAEGLTFMLGRAICTNKVAGGCDNDF